MGNKIARLTVSIDERYTRPQGAYEYKGDFRKLRRLILNGQLAPCYPGMEEQISDLDECPICFLFYPSLNRSKCCSKSICTECYLQIRSSGFAVSVQCPFCKTSNYMVEFRGARTAKEKEFEQAEEQKVIEAKIRSYQKELQDQKQRLMRGSEDTLAGEGTLGSARGHGLPNHNHNGQQFDSLEHDNFCFEQHDPEDDWYLQEVSPHSSREGEIGLDMDEVMLMRAIWRSIQDQGEGSEGNSLAWGNVSSETVNRFGLRRRITGRCPGSVGVAEMRNQVASGSQQTNCQSLDEHHLLRDMTSFRSQNQSDAIQIPQRLLGPGMSSAENDEATRGLRLNKKSYPQMQPESHRESDWMTFVPEDFEEQIIRAMALSLAEADAQAR